MRAIILAGLICATEAGAQAVPPPVRQGPYAVDRWNTDAGLPQNSVNAILQTRDGHLWLGTLGGIARFDGTAFLSITTGDHPELKSDRVYALAEDASGRLWIGTETGLARYARGVVKSFTAQQGFVSGAVRSLASDSSGAIWFGTATGAVGRIEGDTFRVLFPAGGIFGSSIPRIVSSHRTTWISSDSSLFRIDSAGKATLVRRAELHVTLRTALTPDFSGGVWTATDSSIVHLTVTSSAEYLLPSPQKATMGPIHSLATVDNKVIWIGTGSTGVWRFVPDSGVLQQVTDREQGVSTDLIIDREGSVWVGNRVTGLARIRQFLFQTSTTADGLAANNTIAVLADSKGRVWAASRCSGVAVRQAVQFRALSTAEHPGCVVTMAEGAPGEVWMGGTGVGRWRDGHYEALDNLPNAPGSDVRAIYHARDDRLWIASKLGLTSWDGRTFTPVPGADSLPFHVAHFIYEARDGAIWIGTERGAFRQTHGTFTVLTTADGLPHDDIRGMYQDSSGAIWFATYGGGLARFSGGKITVYTTADGLLDNYLSSVTEDSSGHLWLSGNRGVFRVARRELESHSAGSATRLHVVAYGRADGMLSSETNGGFQPAFTRTADGHLWYPTLVGVTTIDPTANVASVPPRVSLDRVLVNGQPNDPDDGLSIGPGAVDLQVDYSGLSLSAPNAVSYRYRLTDWDKDWIEAGTRRSANYSRLSPGQYRFAVMAANRDGVWSTASEVSFTVQPYVWQTWWFRTLVVLAIAMIPIVQGRRLRRRQVELTRLVEEKTVELRHQKDEIEDQARALEKQNEILAENVRLKDDVERISRHDLRTPLTSIISLAQIVREEASLPSEHDASLRLIEQAGYRVLNMANLTLDLFKMEQGTYRLNPRAIDIRSVIERVLLDLQAVMRTLEVECDVTGDGADDDLVHVQGDELLSHSMLSNVVKNAIEASPPRHRVGIAISSTDDRVSIRVHNDGAIPVALRARLFEKYSTGGKDGGTGLGAYSARLMAQTQGGTIHATSSDETGTTVVIEMMRAGPPERRESARIDRGATTAAADAATGPRSILIVDDDENTRAIVRHFLTRDGWTVDEAENGPLALRKFEDLHYDCVFMDIEMPVMGGFDVVGRMRASELERRTGHATIVALSSHDDAATRDRAIESGFDRYLTKPASRQRVMAVVMGEELPDDIDVPPSPAGLAVTLDPDLRHLLPSFVERKISEAATLEDDLGHRDADAVRRLSHKMRGSLSLYGFGAASRTCAEIELAAESSDFEAIVKRLPVLRDQLAEIERRVTNENVQEV